jgi:TolB-like protein
MASLFSELKRRNVFRVGIAYIVVAWLIVQVLDVMLPTFGAPDWVQKVLILIVGLGLPISLLFAWAYEMTPQGVMKTEDVDRSDSITSSTGQRLNYVVIAVLIMALGFFIWERQQVAVDAGSSVSDTSQSVADINLDKRSIAVLPFVNMSSDPEQEWFADGLTEELLNSLARTADLLVAARTSSFKFKDSQEDIPTIAAALGVAHVLEGSVRRSGDRLRVTAQLIRAADGFHLWSQTYDRDPADVIAVQEDLAIAIANALETAMDPAALAQMVSMGTSSVPAYEAYLEGLSLITKSSQTGEESLILEARNAFGIALELDPGFSKAYAEVADFYSMQLRVTTLGSSLTSDDPSELQRKYEDAIRRAIATTSDEVQQSAYEADLSLTSLKYVQALNRINEVIRNRPNDRDALELKSAILIPMGRREESAAVQSELLAISGDDADELQSRVVGFVFSDSVDSALPVITRALGLYPNNPNMAYQFHRALMWAGQYDEARPLLEIIRGSEMDAVNALIADARQSCADNDYAATRKLYDEILISNQGTTVPFLAHYLFGEVEEANALLRPYHDSDDLIALASYLNYPFFDAAYFPKLQAILDEQGIVRGALLAIPFACKQPVG